MENEKLNMANLLGVSILLKQLLEQDLLTHDEAEAVMRKMLKDNGFSETYPMSIEFKTGHITNLGGVRR